MKLTVMGAGSFGTAMANHLAKMGHNIRLWCRSPEQADAINSDHVNPRYLKKIELHEALIGTSDFTQAVEFADRIILAVPTQSVREVLEKLKSLPMDGKKILSLAKGIEIKSKHLLHQVAEEVLSGVCYSALSGPSHAEEVVKGLPTAVVVASRDMETAEEWQTLLNSQYFRVYTSRDVKGVELGGAVKNIIAIAAGAVQALDMGDNAKAALMTRGLAEIMRLGVSVGVDPMTLSGLAGIGDLMVTCYSLHSRNLRFGMAIGRGLSASEAAAEIGQVVEGAHTVKALVSMMSGKDIELPVTESVHAILYEGAALNDIIK